jgi:hypothetical protein
MANEQAETDYVDAVSVLAVDHAADVTVAPSSDGAVHALGALQLPFRAVDYRGHDALARVRAADGWSWESRPSRRDTTRAEDLRDGVVLAFARPRGATTARLVVDGTNTPWAALMVTRFVAAHGRATQAWYDSLATDPRMARALGAMIAREGFLDVQVRGAGGWVHQEFMREAGPEVSKRQVVTLDLKDVEGDTVEIRLESAPMFWLVDHVALDFTPARAVQATELHAARATDARARDLRPTLRTADRGYQVLETGDVIELAFRVPPVPVGLRRSDLLRSTGWYRIHSPDTAEPDIALLREVMERPRGAARVSVARFNEAMQALDAAAR